MRGESERAWAGRKTKHKMFQHYTISDYGVSVNNTKCCETMALLLSTQISPDISPGGCCLQTNSHQPSQTYHYEAL